MIYKLQNGWTIPLGGDYLEYLQSIPEIYGGYIQPSIKVEPLPKKFNGSQKAARTYAEGYQKGAKPVTKAIDNAGQKIFNTTKNIAMFVPGPIGATTWLGQMGADTANGEYSKVAKDLGAAILIGTGLKGTQVGAKAAGRALVGKGVNIPRLDAYDYSALRNEYFNNAANKVSRNTNIKSNPILNSTIDHLYTEYPELSSIGPKEAYRQYYETIFPASKVQTPYAHGTRSNLTGGLEASIKVPNAAAPETIGRNDFYLNLQPEASLQYADGIGVPKGFTWNKHRFWPLKEILGKPYKSDAWMSKPIKLREQVPNRAGQFSRVKNADGTYSGHGKLLEEYKAELGMQGLSNEEFLQRLGVQNEESFNQWVAKNRQMFSNIYDSGDYHGLYHVKIDASKPLTINGGNTYYSERGIWDRMNKGGNDVLLHNNAVNEFGSDVAVVRDITPQKVRILGSKPDQQGFTDFMGGRQQFFTEVPTSHKK